MSMAPLTDFSRRFGLDDIEQFLDPTPAPLVSTATRRSVPYIGPERPGDAFNARVTGGEILSRLGFTLSRRDRNGDEHYVRPGKERRQGTSATVYGDDGHTTIWSDTCIAMWPALSTRRPYDPFGLYAGTSHRGDWRAATTELARQGYGEAHQPDDLSWAEVQAFVAPANGPDPTEVADAGAPVEEADDEWPDPEPLEPELTNGPPFPIEVLPTWIAEAATSCAEALQAPVDLPAMLALGGLSAITMGKVQIQVDEFADDRWIEGTNLYIVTALPPGAAKSPAFKAMLGCVRELEHELVEQRASDIREAEVTKEILTKRAKSARDAAALPGKTADDAKEAGRLQAEADMVVIPSTPRLIADDATPEALVMLLAKTGERIALMSSEGGLFDMMAGQYADRGKTASLEIYLKAWSGDAVNTDRASREAIALQHPLLSVCVTPQPILIKRLGENAELAGRGVSARFLYSVPASNVGGRDRRARRRQRTPGARARYDEQMTAIGRRMATWVNPVTLQLSAEAADAFEDWDQEHEYRLAPGQDLALMAEWMMKLRAYVLRTAALLHIAEGADIGEPVSMATLDRVFVLADYWIEHARCVHTSWGNALNAVARPARILVRWAVEEGLASFTQRDAYMKLRRHDNAVKIGDVIEVIEQLIAMGWLRAEGEFPGHRGKTATLLVHPRAAEALHAHDAQPENVVVDNPEVARHESCAYRPDFSPSLPSELPDPTGAENSAHTRNSHDAQPVEEPAPSSTPPSVTKPADACLPAEPGPIEPAGAPAPIEGADDDEDWNLL